MTEGAAAELLLQEYLAIQKIYEGYNAQSLSIKEWSVSIGIASLLAAYAKPVAEMRGRAVVVLAALVSVPFYLTDALWKSYQAAYLPRLREIEAAFRDMAGDQPAALQAIASWAKAYGDGVADAPAEGALTLYLGAMANPAVLLPHAVLLVLGLVMAWAYPPHPPARRETRA